MNFTAVLVDDEPFARAHLRGVLESNAVTVIGEAENVQDGLKLIEDLRPALLFLDISMPGMTGLQMAQIVVNMEPAPLIIFVTGYSEHAVEAFEHGALGYLVKPVSAERLASTLVRARARLADSTVQEQKVEIEQKVANDPPLRRLPVRSDYAVKLIRVEEILYAAAQDKRVVVHSTDGTESRTYYTLTQLEKTLPPDMFVRIHDGFLVNQDNIEELVFLGNHAYEVRLTNKVLLPVGRRRYAELKRRLGLSGS